MKKFLALLGILSALSCLPIDARADEEAQEIPIPANLPPAVFPLAPRLATTPAELEKLKAQPDFAAIKVASLQAANALLANPVVIPDGFGDWVFYYACPDDGSTLVALNATEHQCPIDRKTYSDERTVGAYRGILHTAAENAAQQLGWAYAYSGDEKYASEIKRILMKLAHDYPAYPARRDRWGNLGVLAPLGGRRYVQSLDEATGIIRLAKAYDLSHNAKVWLKDDHRLVEENLFRLTADTLLERNQDINNHQTWYNAGLMAIASVLADAELARKVLTMPGGYYDQLNRSIGKDGLWYEGTTAYQNYALQAMAEIVDAGRHMGLPLQNEPKLRAMIVGPSRAAYPDGSFPVINDSDPGSTEIFNWAISWYNKLGSAQISQQPSSQSEDLSDAGLAILRQGKGADAVAVFMDYGQHGGGHGHFDKLNITLFANGREWLLDPGRLTYSHKEYKTWVKESAAHNTVTRNGKSQRATKGELLYLQNGAGFSAASIQNDGAFPGAVLRRNLLLTDKFLVDVFEIESEAVATWDWFAHAAVAAVKPFDARSQSTPLTTETLGLESGYQHMSTPLAWNNGDVSRWDFLSDKTSKAGLRLGLWLIEEKGEEFFTAEGIGYNIGQKVPILVRRRKAARTRFVTVYDLSGQGNAIQNVRVNGKEILVQAAGAERVISFSPGGAMLK